MPTMIRNLTSLVAAYLRENYGYEVTSIDDPLEVFRDFADAAAGRAVGL